MDKKTRKKIEELIPIILLFILAFIIRFMGGTWGTKWDNDAYMARHAEYIYSFGSSLFCMGNSISLLSAEADYMRGMLNVERP